MSFFKNFLTNKSIDLPLETRTSAISRETVETNPRVRSSSSCQIEDLPPSTRTNISKERNKYLNLVNQELNNENEKLKCKIDDLKITVLTNKNILEEFASNNSKMERTVKLLKSQIDLMTMKLRENNIDFDEHLDVRFDDHKYTRSNSPSEIGPMSTLTTDRITKNGIDDKMTSVSVNNSEDKFTTRLNNYHNFPSLHCVSKSKGEVHHFKEKKSLKKVNKKRSKRDGSTVSSNSSQPITSYRTAPVVKSVLNTPKIENKDSELHERIRYLEKELEYYKNKEVPKFNISENKHYDIFDVNHEEVDNPVSFRDNMVEENEDNLKLE